MGRNRIYIRAEKFGLLALIPLYFIVVGLMIQPLSDIIPGLWRIIKEPDFLITDYFLVGGIGAAFINAGLLTLAAIGTIYFLGMEMDGHTITSSCLMFGFSLFGKNLMNIWAILLEYICIPNTIRPICPDIFTSDFTVPVCPRSLPRSCISQSFHTWPGCH